MKPPPTATPEILQRLTEEQRKLALDVRTEPGAPDVLGAEEARTVRHVAGGDVSYNQGSSDFFAAAVVLELPSLELLEVAGARMEATFPYVPGYLSFREAPVMVAAVRKLQCVPQVVLVDGHGVAHPRGIGVASHCGLLLGLPTVGCAKKLLRGSCEPVGQAEGETSALVLGGQTIGVALRTRRRARPIYVSPGHRIDRDGALELVRRCLDGYRLPAPTRHAHAQVNRMRREAQP